MTFNKNYADASAALMNDFMGGLPDEVKQIVGASMERLLSSDVGSQAPGKGEQAPEFTLQDIRGGSVSLSQLLAKGPVVLSFYRGSWCPFCNLEFQFLREALSDIKNLGAGLVFISPEQAQVTVDHLTDMDPAITVLADPANRVATEYGLVFSLDEAMRPLYADWGINVPAANGDDSYTLPIPASYVIATDGSIKAAYVEKNYTLRMEPEEILDTLRSMI
ncbi:MAG: AhpC/TSA family protein [Gammaproteobacteria bacterium]|nr:AhpC/TSA family protein [Gammaproteobacteria bacterium]